MSSTTPANPVPGPLWRSPLGAKWFMFTVLVALGLTIAKIATDICFIPRDYVSNGKKLFTYDVFNLVLYGCWLIGPPLIFLYEYVFLFGKDASRRLDKDQVADIKYVHDLASKMWAGVSVFLGIMLLLKYGVKFT